MDAREAFRIADAHVDAPEVDALFTELLRVPSEHTERMESDPAVTAFVADAVAPRLEALTGVAPRTDGMGNLLSGLAGTPPNTTYSTSISLAELTGVAARRVGVYIGIIFMLLALSPKVTALLIAIPNPVGAAYVTLLIALLFYRE